MTPIIEAKNLRKDYSVRRKGGWGMTSFAAFSDIDLAVERGETLCVVGESGCGKSSLARVLAGLTPSNDGQAIFDGEDISMLTTDGLKKMRQRNQFIFQDPYASLNPRWTLARIVAEPLENFTGLSAAQRRKRAAEMLERVGLSAADMDRLPREISGGQRQRVGIARAIVCEPDLVIADEAVSALDVSVKAQILNLMMDLQREMDLSYIFISHDVGAVRAIADRVLVMYLGRVMETGPAHQVLNHPAHPYTKRLISSVPVTNPARRLLLEVSADEVPSALNPPSGCVFRTRCPRADNMCLERPPLTPDQDGRALACHHPLNLPLKEAV